MHSFLSENLLDIAVGMHVYTYPRIDKVTLLAFVPRPHGFSVYEIVNNINLKHVKIGELGRAEKCSETYIYVVEKVNLDSFAVCDMLKKLMKCAQCDFLGLKDAEAVARQVIILNGCAKPVTEVNMNTKEGFIRARLWQCDANVIHNGNSFSVRISVAMEHLDVVKKRLQLLDRYGYKFLNFFGHQRFGTKKPVTHLIGKLLVGRDWDKLIEVMCKSRFKYDPGTPEHRVCKAWDRYRDEEAIIKSIPKRYAILYINAYQSYLFNLTLSSVWLRLVEAYGFEKALDKLCNEYRYLPIIGSELQVHQEFIRSVIEEILEVEDVEPRQFNIEILNINARGDIRRSVEQAHNVITSFNHNEIWLEFALGSGCYATTFLREILRIDPILYTMRSGHETLLISWK